MKRGREAYDYDLVIVGGGSAGIVAGNVAGALGARVALVEKSRIGGECLWTGCVPSKALLHVADTARTMRSAGAELGLKNVRLSRDDCAGAFGYVRRKIEEVRTNDATEQMLRDFGVDIFFGDSFFMTPHLLRTPQGDLRAAAFLLATGSSPVIPPIRDIKGIGFVTNTTLFDLDHVPASLAVIGGGYIGCEMGQALARLGARVTLIDRGERLLKGEDAELTDILTRTLHEEGIETVFRAKVTAARKNSENGGKVVIVKTAEGAEREIRCEEILVATGRKGNTENLGLETAGVALNDAGYVSVDAAGRTSAGHIWACGDVTGQYQFSHMAEHEAKILVRSILFPGSQAVPLDIVPWAIFTDPELAHVGLTEAEAREKHGDIQVLRHSFRQDDRAIVENRTTGLVKVITTGINGKIVGAHVLGPNAGDLIHEWALAMRHKLPVRALADLIHVYPTFSVSNQRAAQRWYGTILEKPLVKGALSTLFGLKPRGAGNL